ncbi:ketopantoate reductase family protein [Amaricoccus solimangrovi]|uniref:2-dehydropantoate 2-reductase n=1 Tax=Amaricoccus solimangrovi TaxID=2589815 RepID=A0A501WYM8_9RHOB|nr:2-dehydropantoate 2-reductase N-terminal domain-containing protein [Amaricoccus solimangrovi]TPE52667.1 ketopantoate reductase family protein [Amaricoccus solimangrovi]
MRVIVYGVGAIGGTVAAALALSGQEVVGVARGSQLAAIRAGGLSLLTPDRRLHARFDCLADPGEIDLRPDDAVLLTMKTQDTVAALERLRAVGLRGQPVFCVQNGVANERFALRRFANVHAVTVMMPASFTKPGEVAAFASPRHGIFEIGRYPEGCDADDEALAAALERANIATFVTPRVMESKYGKLIVNLSNAVEAAVGPGARETRYPALLRAEAEAVLETAGIAWRDVGAGDPRREALMRWQPIPGVERIGGSSVQSLVRGTGSIETDYLNGEIALLGRLFGVPTPVNAAFVEIGARMVRDGRAPGTLGEAEVAAALAAQGA